MCTDEQGKVVMKATVATEEKAIVTLVKSAGPRVQVAFEEGTQAQWLHDLLLVTPSAWSYATYEDATRSGTRTTASTLTRCRSGCTTAH